MLNNKQASIVFLLILAVGFTGWWILKHQQGNGILLDRPHNPDSIADDVLVININAQGNPASRFSAVRMVHYPYQDTTLTTQPNLVIYVNDEQPWTITANHGKAIEGSNSIQLWDNVKFHQPAGSDKPASTVLTESFTYWPNRQFGETDKPVTLLQPGVKVTAVGLTANTITGKVDLLNEVRSSYVAQS